MRILERQNLMDAAIQKTGSVESVFEFALLNDLSITQELDPGMEIKEAAVIDRDIADHFRSANIHPSTGIIKDDYDNTIKEEGIEAWAIEVDFIVS